MFRILSPARLVPRIARPTVVVAALAATTAVTSFGAPAMAQSAGDVEFLTPSSLQVITSADRDDPFVIRLPEAASCVGDTASEGWVWHGYLTAASVSIPGIQFGAGGPTPQQTGATLQLPLFDSEGFSPVASRPTAAATSAGGPGLVTNVPSFSFGALAEAPLSEIPEGVYNVGVACTRQLPGQAQEFDKFWNSRIEISHAGATFTWAPQAAAPVPDVPAISIVTPGDGQLVVDFDAATTGAAADSFTVSATDGTDTFTASGAASPITVTGLTNDVEYTVTVVAINTGGSSEPSTGVTATPTSGAPVVPGAPVSVAATAGDGRTEVSFTPGDGAAATSFEVTVTDGTDEFEGIGSASPITVIGLTNGVEYDVTVVAINADGRSPASTPIKVTPVAATTAPGVPTIDSITPGDGTLTVAFTPDPNGGSATEFTVTAVAVGSENALTEDGITFTESGPSSPITVTGLTNGTEYTVTVTATNGVGSSAASASATATAGPQDAGGSTTGGTTTGGTTGGTTTGGTTTGGTTTGGTTAGGSSTGGSSTGGSSTGGSTGFAGSGGSTGTRTLAATGPSGTVVFAIWAVLLLIVGRVVILSGRKTKIISDQP